MSIKTILAILAINSIFLITSNAQSANDIIKQKQNNYRKIQQNNPNSENVDLRLKNIQCVKAPCGPEEPPIKMCLEPNMPNPKTGKCEPPPLPPVCEPPNSYSNGKCYPPDHPIECPQYASPAPNGSMPFMPPGCPNPPNKPIVCQEGQTAVQGNNGIWICEAIICPRDAMPFKGDDGFWSCKPIFPPEKCPKIYPSTKNGSIPFVPSDCPNPPKLCTDYPNEPNCIIDVCLEPKMPNPQTGVCEIPIDPPVCEPPAKINPKNGKCETHIVIDPPILCIYPYQPNPQTGICEPPIIIDPPICNSEARLIQNNNGMWICEPLVYPTKQCGNGVWDSQTQSCKQSPNSRK